MLGGTSSIWGGRCIPFDPEDFAPADGRPGWPIPFGEMAAHVAEALEFLDAGKAEFSADSALPINPVSLKKATRDLDIDRIERYSNPTNMWRKWGNHIGAFPQCGGLSRSDLHKRNHQRGWRPGRWDCAPDRLEPVVQNIRSNGRIGLRRPRDAAAAFGVPREPILRAGQRARSCGPFLHDASGERRP
jgi:choline dehydrogenase-like flavoprotein